MIEDEEVTYSEGNLRLMNRNTMHRETEMADADILYISIDPSLIVQWPKGLAQPFQYKSILNRFVTENLSERTSSKRDYVDFQLLGEDQIPGIAEEIIEAARKSYETVYKAENFGKSPSSYASDIWFKYVKNRRPVLIVYFVDVNTSDENQKKQATQFRIEMEGNPVVGLAMGLLNSDNAELISKNKFKANKIYNWFEKDEIIAESEEEE